MFAVHQFQQARGRLLRHGLLLGAVVALLAVAGAASAQTSDAPKAQAPVKGRVWHVNLPKQPLGKALTSIGRLARVEIVFDPDSVRGKTAAALRGNFSVEDALTSLLAGSGLAFSRSSGGVYMVAKAPEPEPTAGMPEILIRSDVDSWSLNTGIRRTQDDTQPYVVITHEDIVRSGALSLDQILRDQVTSNGSAGTADQTGNQKGQGLGLVNLRGLGSNATLILVDGRRVPGVSNINDATAGFVGQTQLPGIPIDSIERIEILASSASGIYGSNAAGGVINIIQRRDYKGLVATLTDGGTYDGGGGSKRLDLSGGTRLEDGRTKISFSGSYFKQDPLEFGNRDLVQNGFNHILSVNPNFYTTAGQGLGRVVLGATPNIQSANGSPLVLKNGTSLGSPITYLPAGYTSADGTGPLVADAGHYNFNLAPTADGAFSPFLVRSRTLSGTLAVEREFTSWLKAYFSASVSDNRTESAEGGPPDTFTLSSTAPNNPFRQNILVTAPQVGADSTSVGESKSHGFVAGAAIKLPFRWQAILDASETKNAYSVLAAHTSLDPATTFGILNGSLNLLQDLRTHPLPYGFAPIPNGNTPSESKGNTVSFRLAGPIPFKLPGGEPVVTLLAERDEQDLGGIVSWVNALLTSLPPGVTNATAMTLAQVTAAEGSYINYIGPRSEVTSSGYGEIRIPIVGTDNHVPLMEALDLQFAGRYDRYDVKAQVADLGFLTSQTTRCGVTFGSLTPAAINAPCPSASQKFDTGESVRTAFDPSVSLKWQVYPDIALRASYATGFIPPLLSALSPNPPLVLNTGLFSQLGQSVFTARDPLRGNEIIGSTVPTLTLISGGNPNVKPETSDTWSAGVILTPRWVPGLRLSADWTHISQKDAYFSPSAVLNGMPSPSVQAEFNTFLAANPGRFIRGAPSGGYAVGPIISVDETIANATGSATDALDMTAQYSYEIPRWGVLTASANATYVDSLTLQVSPGSVARQFAGVAGGGFGIGSIDFGGVKWKGNVSVAWSTNRWSLGLRARYFGPYHFDYDPTYMPPGQGATTEPSQTYLDLFGSYKLPYKMELRLVINDLLNKAPPFEVESLGYYSRYGDPRMGSYFVSFVKSF